MNAQIKDLNEELMLDLSCSIFLPIFFSSLFLLLWGKRINPPLVALGLLAVFAFVVFYSLKIWRKLDKRKTLRLGYEGELAVGLELNHLMLDGYRVYHDLEAGKFNIDHIVVGPAGVFAVETKTRSKPVRSKGSNANKVICDGNRIQYPDYSDESAIQQSIRQAKWLQQWLSSAVGDPVAVQPIVTLPGWFVERTSPNGVPVMNPKQIRSLLVGKEAKLSESMIRRIVHQLEQKCRNVEPMTVALEKNQ